MGKNKNIIMYFLQNLVVIYFLCRGFFYNLFVRQEKKAYLHNFYKNFVIVFIAYFFSFISHAFNRKQANKLNVRLSSIQRAVI